MREQDWKTLRKQVRCLATKNTTLYLFATDVILALLSWSIWVKTDGFFRVLSLSLLLFALIHFYLILHEAIHKSISSRTWVNNAIGHFCGWFIFLPFLPRQRNHLLHHKWVAHPSRDPENSKLIEKFSVTTKTNQIKLELIWRFYLPLIALNHFIGTWRSPFEKWREGGRSSRIGREITSEKIYLLAYLLVILILLATQYFILFLTWFTPAWLCLLLVVELLNLPHHAETPLLSPSDNPLPYWKQNQVSHSCASIPLWSRFVILNFNLHITHHYFPSIPWYELARADRLIEPDHSHHPIKQNEFSWTLANRRRPLLELMGHYFDKRRDEDKSTRI